ncbi:MAG: KTSC domain-containing protein [Chitinophagaceae bacterium]
MKRGYVESSIVKTAGYDRNELKLEVELKKGTIFQYFKVPETVYDEMRLSSSYGRYYLANIRGKYQETEVKKM